MFQYFFIGLLAILLRINTPTDKLKENNYDRIGKNGDFTQDAKEKTRNTINMEIKQNRIIYGSNNKNKNNIKEHIVSEGIVKTINTIKIKTIHRSEDDETVKTDNRPNNNLK